MGGCPINAIDLARTLRSRGSHVRLLAPVEEVAVSVIPYAESHGFTVGMLPEREGPVRRGLRLRRIA
jgi:hypothetical protein